MANPEHLKILKQGVETWNKWRKENHDTKIDLREADLDGRDFNDINFYAADLSEANLNGSQLRDAKLSKARLKGSKLARANLNNAFLSNAYLSQADLNNANMINTHFIDLWDDEPSNLAGANLESADLTNADLRQANLSGANFSRAVLKKAELSFSRCNDPWENQPTVFNGADLSDANLSGMDLRKATLREAVLIDTRLAGANLEEADLVNAKLERTDLCRANLYGADLSYVHAQSVNFQGAQLAETNFTGATLEGCYLFGGSAWELKLEGAKQKDLFINHPDDPALTVDNIELAQFIHLLLSNRRIRDVIDTITSKVVLILGRFAGDRKAVLDAIRDELRKRNYIPVLFDFDKPASKDITGTIETLSRMARFIVADLTDPSSVPHELATIVPFMRTTPIVPIRLKGSSGYTIFDDYESAYKWVLKKYEYESENALIELISEKIIEPAQTKAKELQKEK